MDDCRSEIKGIGSRFEYYWKEHGYSIADVVFLVGPNEEEVRGVKFLLVVSSAVFETLFNNTWSTCRGQDERIRLPHIDPIVFRHFIQLLWKDNGPTMSDLTTLNLSLKQALALFFVSKEFLVNGLKDTCEELIRQYIRVETVLEIYEQFYGKDEEQLEMDTFNFVFRHIDLILEHGHFLQISKETMMKILQSNALVVAEVKLFQGVMSWGECRAVKENSWYTTMTDSGTITILRKILADCLPEIRFPIISIEDFRSLIRPTGLLTDEESLKLYDYWTLNDDTKYSSNGHVLNLSSSLLVWKNPRSSYAARSITLSGSKNTVFQDCNGTSNYIVINSSREAGLVGMGFCGPILGDSTYEVKVWIEKTVITQKTVFVKRGCPFNVQLSVPIHLQPNLSQGLYFSLQGGKTGEAVRDQGSVTDEHGTCFTFNNNSHVVQLHYILY